jgi:hypothetical protein
VSGFEKLSFTFTVGTTGYWAPDRGSQPGDCSTPTGPCTFTRQGGNDADCGSAGGCFFRVYCSSGKTAIGGGYLFDDTTFAADGITVVQTGLSVNITGANTSTNSTLTTHARGPVGDHFRVGYNTIGLTGHTSPTITVLVRCATTS